MFEKMKQRRLARNIAKREDAVKGTTQYNRIQNRINKLSGDPTRRAITGSSDYNRSTWNQSGLGDTSKLDPSSHEDTLALQRKLFPDDPSQWDGVFGPNTEAAYREYMGTGGDNPLLTAAENDGIVERDGIWGADSDQTFSDAGQSSVNQDANYEGNYRNQAGAAMYGLSNPDAEWEDKNWLEKIATSMPGVGGNPTLGQFWGNMFGGGGLTKKVK